MKRHLRGGDSLNSRLDRELNLVINSFEYGHKDNWWFHGFYRQSGALQGILKQEICIQAVLTRDAGDRAK
jgi:hypothetical protein